MKNNYEKLIWVSLAVSNPLNDMSITFISGVSVHNWLYLEGDNLFRLDKDKRFWIDGFLGIPVYSYASGNWYWDEVLITVKHCARMLNWLRGTGWSIAEAEKSIWAIWESGHPINCSLVLKLSSLQNRWKGKQNALTT